MGKRKLLSLLMAFLLIVSVSVFYLPAVRVQGSTSSPEEQLFNTLLTKFSPLKNVNDALKFVQMVDAIDNQDTLMTNIEKALEEDQNGKQILLNNGFNKEKIAQIIQVLREQFPSVDEVDEDNTDSTYFFIKLLLDDDPQYSEYCSEMKNMAIDIYDVLPVEFKEDLDRYRETKDEKVSFLLNFVNEFIDDKAGTGTYDAGKGKWTSVDFEVTDGYIDRANEILSSPINGEPIVLGPDHKESINILLDVIEEQIKDTGVLDDACDLLYKASLINKNTINLPGGGGGGDGGDEGGGGTEPSTDTREDEEQPVSGIIDEDAIAIEVKDGVTTVSADEGEMLSIIEQVADAAEEERQEAARVVLPIDGVDSADLAVSLPDTVINSLQEEGVDLVITSDSIEYNIPSQALANQDIPKGAFVEFKSRELGSEEVDRIAQAAEVKGRISKVLGLSLEIKTKNEVRPVTTFNTYIVVKVNVQGAGEKDKLGLYYLNEETGKLEFVGGKVKGDKLVFKVNHYSKYVVIESSITFTDIANHWAKYYVESMAAKRVVDGYPDGTFKPEGIVTRAQFIKMIINALELDTVEYSGEFRDIDGTEWYAGYVATAMAEGLVSGYPDGTFQPDKEITRLEMAVMLGNVIKDIELGRVEAYLELSKFKDVDDIAEWGREQVAKAVKAGIIKGVSENLFDPGDLASRADAATAIYRLYNR